MTARTQRGPGRASASTIRISREVTRAVRAGGQAVALESAVLSHGLPKDHARQLASGVARTVRAAGAIPALVVVRDGTIVVGADPDDIEFLFQPGVLKIAERDLAMAVALRRSGGTTVAGTLAVADRVGLRCIATGGIGGVHLDRPHDVSADLLALTRYPAVVVCGGAKIICDVEQTVEALDTLGVPVIGYRTDTFPAFLLRSSGIALTHRVETAEEIAAVQRARTAIGARAALLVVQPPPEEIALDAHAVNEVVAAAVRRAREEAVRGPALTPYLLAAIAQATDGRSLKANLGLLHANAALAAEIAVASRTTPHRAR